MEARTSNLTYEDREDARIIARTSYERDSSKSYREWVTYWLKKLDAMKGEDDD